MNNYKIIIPCVFFSLFILLYYCDKTIFISRKQLDNNINLINIDNIKKIIEEEITSEMEKEEIVEEIIEEVTKIEIEEVSDENNIEVKEEKEDNKEVEKENNEVVDNKEVINNDNNYIDNEILDEDLSIDANAKLKAIMNYVKQNNLMYYYVDLTSGYEIKYNENNSVYGASLIKLVEAIYLIDNDIDLQQTILYESRYQRHYSTGMKNHSIGEYISLEKLMDYSISYSDNTAHMMLHEYIGRDNLQAYGRGLGARVILEGSDTYGNQTASDMIIYLKKAYELINEKEDGKKLKQYMYNNYQNSLNFDNIEFAHKYGFWSPYFHDVGIYFGEHPYLIAVLTLKGSSNYIQNLSRLTYDFHNQYISDLETIEE